MSDCNTASRSSALKLSSLCCIISNGVELTCHSKNGTFFRALLVDNCPEFSQASIVVVDIRPESAQSASLTVPKKVQLDHSSNLLELPYSKSILCAHESCPKSCGLA